MLYGSRKPWKIDNGLPADLIPTRSALSYIDRPHANALWWARDRGRLRAWHLGYVLGWSLAELRQFLEERDGAAPEPSAEVLASVIDVSAVPRDVISPEEAARLANVAPSWFRAMTARGDVPSTSFAGQRVYSRSAVQLWMAEGVAVPA